MNDYAAFYRAMQQMERDADRGNRRQRRQGTPPAAAWESAAGTPLRYPDATDATQIEEQTAEEARTNARANGSLAMSDLPAGRIRRIGSQEQRQIEIDTEAEAARQQARREYSALPDQAGIVTPIVSAIADPLEGAMDRGRENLGIPGAREDRIERDRRWARGARRASEDILAEGHGGQLMDWAASIPEAMRQDAANRTREDSERDLNMYDRSLLRSVAEPIGDFWTGMSAMGRDARGETAAEDARRNYARRDYEIAAERGNQAFNAGDMQAAGEADIAARSAARTGRTAELRGDAAAGTDFWTNAPWAAEFAPEFGMVQSLARFPTRVGLRAAGQEVPEALARPNLLSETQAAGPATQNARGWRNNTLVGGGAYAAADAADGQMGDDPGASLMAAGGAMAYGRRFIPNIDSAIPADVAHLARQGEVGADGARNYTPRPRQRLTVDPQGRVAMDYEGSFNTGDGASVGETRSVMRGAREALDRDIAETRRSEYSWTPNDERQAALYRSTFERDTPTNYTFSELPQAEGQPVMRLRRLGAEFEPDPLQAQPVPEGAPFGFEGAPQAGRIIDAEATPAPARRFEAAVRDPETGQVYRGEDHQQAIDSAPDEAVRARLQAAYDAAVEDPSVIGFQVDGQFMGREDGLAALRERAGRGRQVRIGEQVNADGSVTPRSPIDWNDPNTRLPADDQWFNDLAGMPTPPRMNIVPEGGIPGRSADDMLRDAPDAGSGGASGAGNRASDATAQGDTVDLSIGGGGVFNRLSPSDQAAVNGSDGYRVTLPRTRLSLRDLPEVTADMAGNEVTVGQYARQLRQSEAPAIVVARENGQWRILDGHTRTRAARQAGRRDIEVLDATDLIAASQRGEGLPSASAPNAGPRRLGDDTAGALVAGGIGGGVVGSALEGEAQASDGSGSDGVPMLPILGPGIGVAATLPFLLRRGRSGRLADELNSQVGMFAGVNARTADRAALARAQEMATSGASRESIWQETGWFQGVDGKWRFEIDDSGANIVRTHNGNAYGNLEDGLEHPELYDAYPEMRETRLGFEGDMRASGSYRAPRDEPRGWGGVDGTERVPAEIRARGANPGSLRSTTLHEVQHGVQGAEGFARGGMPSLSDAPLEVMQRIAALNRELEELKRSPPMLRDMERYRAVSSELRSLRGQANEQARDVYNRLSGEVEARNVSTRRNMTQAQRERRPPWETQDVPDDQQIVRFDGDRAESRATRRLGSTFDSGVNPERPPVSEAQTGTEAVQTPARAEQTRARGFAPGSGEYRAARNARILELLDEMQPVRNARTGAANPNARLGERLDNGYPAIAERLRAEGYGEVTASTISGVVHRNRARPAATAPSASDEAAAQRLGMSVERYRSLSARKRNEAIAALGVTGGGAALLYGGEADAQGFDPNGQWIGEEQRRDLGDRTEIRQRFRDSQGRIYEGVRFQDHANGAISAPQFTPIDPMGAPDLTQTYDPSEVPLRPEEIARIQEMRDAEARRLGQPVEQRQARAASETEPTTPAWALAAPVVAGVIGGRVGRRLGEQSGRPLAGETAGALLAGGVTGGGSGVFTDAQDAGELATFGTALGAGGRFGYRVGQEGIRRGAEAAADIRLPRRRVRGQPLPYIGDDAAAPMSQPGSLRPPPARQPDRVSGSLDEGDLAREMSGRAVEEGRRRLRPTPVTMEERLNIPAGDRGSLEGRLGTLGAEPLRELARREGLPTEGKVRELARRLADAARADPARVQRYRDVFQALGVSGLIVGGASQLLPQNAEASGNNGDMPEWADEAGLAAGATGLALMGRTALPQALERVVPRNARLGQMSRVGDLPMDVPARAFDLERSSLGRLAPRRLESEVDPRVVAGGSALAAGPVAWGAAELLDPYAESPQEQEARYMRDVLPYLELQQQALRLHARGVRSDEVADPALAEELQRLEAGGSEGARRLGVRSEAAPAN